MNIDRTKETNMLIARKLMAGAAEFFALALFVGMIWVWAALAAAPGV